MSGDYRDAFSSVSSALQEFQEQLAQRERLTGRSLAEEFFETRTAAAAAAEYLRASDLQLQPQVKLLQDGLSLRRAAFGDVADLLTATYSPATDLDVLARSLHEKLDLTSTLEEQLAEINQFSASILSDVDWQLFAGTFSHVEEIARGTAQFSLAYQRLQEVLDEKSAELGFSPYLERLSAVEVFAHANLLGSLNVRSSGQKPQVQKPQAQEKEAQKQQQEEEGDVAELRGRVSEESSGTLQGRLAVRKPILLPLWRGAKDSLNSQNPDRVRHYCVSQRELLLKLLDEVAPDGEVREWTSDPQHYRDGRPTRRAKLLYLTRTQSVRCTQFVVKDVKVVLAVFENLNKGTHQVDAGFSSRELADLQIRADNLLLFLLAMADEANH